MGAGDEVKDDYGDAGVPMLPAVATAKQVSLRIVLYSWAMVLCTCCWCRRPAGCTAGLAAALGGVVPRRAHRLHDVVRRGERSKPMKLFHLSNSYLCAVFVSLAVDSALVLPVTGWPF